MKAPTTTTSQLHEEERHLRAGGWSSWVVSHADFFWLVAITLAGAYCRLRFLNAPVRYDEAFTFLIFVKNGFDQLFDYPVPNNHVLHTLLVRLTTDLFGRELPVIRLTAFVFGTALSPLTFRLCRKLSAGPSGYLAAAGVAVLPYLVLYSSIARGYSLMIALALGVALLGLEFARWPSFRSCACLSLASALGMWTMPSMVFALAGLGVWIAGLSLATQSRTLTVVAYLIAYAVLTTALTLTLYTPTLMVSGVSSVVANRFVVSLPWNEFWAGLGAHLATAASDFVRDVPLAMLIACTLLGVAGLVGTLVTRNWAALSLLPALLVGAAAALVLKHSLPYPRTWSYLLPFALIVSDLGLKLVVARLPASYRPLIPLALLGSTLVASQLIVSRDLLARYPDVGVFRGSSSGRAAEADDAARRRRQRAQSRRLPRAFLSLVPGRAGTGS
jgi:hypothetical protein